MASSQQSYESRLGRFINGNQLLQNWPDYKPSNPEITKKGCADLIPEMEKKNAEVTKTKIPVDQIKAESKSLAFFDKKLENTTCLQKRIDQVDACLKGELGAKRSS